MPCIYIGSGRGLSLTWIKLALERGAHYTVGNLPFLGRAFDLLNLAETI